MGQTWTNFSEDLEVQHFVSSPSWPTNVLTWRVFALESCQLPSLKRDKGERQTVPTSEAQGANSKARELDRGGTRHVSAAASNQRWSSKCMRRSAKSRRSIEGAGQHLRALAGDRVQSVSLFHYWWACSVVSWAALVPGTWIYMLVLHI